MIRRIAILALLQATAVAADDSELCREQSEQIVGRLQAEVVGRLSGEQLAAANDIILDVCEAREKEVEARVEEAVEQAREETGADSGSWFGGSGDKAGNDRLQRRGRY